jgi:hypothetical protein
MRLFACAKGETCKPCGFDIESRPAAGWVAVRYAQPGISVILLLDG